jgi:phosphatidylglycerophosphatase C
MTETIAIFDLDGTITRRDTYRAYLAGFLLRHPRRWLRAVPLAVAAILFAGRVIDDGTMKEWALYWVLAGADRAAIDRWNDRFIASCLARNVRRGAVMRIAAHRRAGHRLILATASLDLYVEALAAELGFGETVSTAINWTPEGRVAGSLAGDNLKGERKLAMLRRRLTAADADTAVAYSDHHGDLPLLRWARRGIAVNPTAALAAAAAREGFAVEDWDQRVITGLLPGNAPPER